MLSGLAFLKPTFYDPEAAMRFISDFFQMDRDGQNPYPTPPTPKTIYISSEGAKPDTHEGKKQLSVEKASVYYYSPKKPMFALYFLRLWLGEAVRHTRPHTRLVCRERYSPPLPLYSVLRGGLHPSRNVLPIMRVRGQSGAAAPGGRDLRGNTQSLTLSLYLNPAPGHVFQKGIS